MDETISSKIENFFTTGQHKTFKKGEVLIRADEEPAGIFFLKQGTVKMYSISENGDELVLNIFKPYSFFPMSWAVNSTKNKYFFEAINDLEVWRMPKEAVLTFLWDNPDVLFDLLRRVYSGIDGLLLRMAYLKSGQAYRRLINEILIYAKRFGDKTDHESKAAITITEKELASHIGITRETVSREMKKLKNKGFVSFSKNNAMFIDIEGLESELTSELH